MADHCAGGGTDIADVALYRGIDPPPEWAELRVKTPVYWNESAQCGSFWAVVAHPVATTVLRDPELFKSGNGMRLDSDPVAVAAAVDRRMLIVSDPPTHTGIRRIMSSAFTPRMVRRLESNMRATVRQMLDRAFEEEVCNFTDVAAHLPLSVVCDILGVPAEDWDFMLDRTKVAWGSTDETDLSRRRECHTEILLYYADLLERRRQEPQDDMITALSQAEIAGKKLSDDEIFLNCDGIISGGNETTRHASVGGLLALINNPEQWRLLQANRNLLGSAIQEILRVTSPAMHAVRTATRSTVLNGAQVREGDRIAVWLAAANRDESVFDGAASFEIRRDPNPHLTFAHGNHRCLGATLATKELEVLFGEIVRRVASAEIRGNVERLSSNLVWGYESAPVALVPKKVG